jgi:hypothetical protein
MSVSTYVGNRNSGKSLPAISVPADGATTTITVPVVM